MAPLTPAPRMQGDITLPSSWLLARLRIPHGGGGEGQEKRPTALQLQERVRPFTPKQARAKARGC